MLTLERPRPPENRETAKLRSSSTKLSQKSGEVPSLILLLSLLMYIQYCATDSSCVWCCIFPFAFPFWCTKLNQAWILQSRTNLMASKILIDFYLSFLMRLSLVHITTWSILKNVTSHWSWMGHAICHKKHELLY